MLAMVLYKSITKVNGEQYVKIAGAIMTAELRVVNLDLAII